MRKLGVGEWVGITVALLLAGGVFLLDGFFQSEPSNVSSEVSDPGSDVPEMVVEGEGNVLGGEADGAAGTFPEGAVPEDVTDEEAAVQ